ncbi:MAG: helix-turn-helix domain-containing protein [Hominilimicola sp.]
MEINDFKSLRKNKGLSREDVCGIVAERGSVLDAARLERIENGKFPIHPDEVLLLSEVYNEPIMCNIYCSQKCPIGARYVEPIEKKELEKIILSMIASLNSIEKKQERLIEITSDGEVDDNELKDFMQIQEELQSISETVEALKFWTEKEIKSR